MESSVTHLTTPAFGRVLRQWRIARRVVARDWTWMLAPSAFVMGTPGVIGR